MKSIMAIAAITLGMTALPAQADDPLAVSAGTGKAAETERRPVLCAFWMIQNMAERAGLRDGSSTSIAESAYPVPAPIWIMENLIGASRTAG